jgi:glycosyltransferase involved in cell wall biosynthesis
VSVVWHVMTGEYPPQRGGVADHTQLVARRLVREGERVRVWTGSGARPSVEDGDASVCRLRHGFGIRSLAALADRIDASGSPSRLVVQYVPQAFGYRGMNLAFCVWLARRREPVWTIFHEVIFPRECGQPARHRLLAMVTRTMAAIVARASERVFVSTPAWAAILRRIAPDAPEAEWLPVPSTIPRVGDRDDAHGIVCRYGGDGARLVGHFGSYGPLIVRHLEVAIPALLERASDASVLLLGEGGVALRQRLVDACPALSRRIWATGPLAAREASLHLLACDLMIQPFVEGVTTRRTSVMAALLHGVPTVTTSGRLTEPLWRQTGAVALAPAADPTALAAVASALLADPEARERLGAAGEAAYDRLFDVRHTIAALRRTDRQALHLAGAHVP